MTMYGPGFSLRSLLENPDLQNPPNLNRGTSDLKKGPKLGGYVPNVNSAFLGSNLWDKPSNYNNCNDSKDFDLEYMDLDEFLSENGIPVNPDDADESQTINLLASALARSPSRSPNPLSPGLLIDPVSPPRPIIVGTELDKIDSFSNMSSPLVSPASPLSHMVRSPHMSSVADSPQTDKVEKSVPSAIERYLLDDDFGVKLPLNTPDQSEITKEVRKRKRTENDTDVAMVTIPVYQHQTRPQSTIHSVASPPQHWESPGPEYDGTQYDSDDSCCSDDTNMVNNMIPGQDGFDPTARKFSVDELKPQPIIKKAKKVFVDDVAKDDKYWQRRNKNNVAAKRSREARRVKENQIAMRAGFLEQENEKLRKSFEKIQRENEGLLKRLSKYEKIE